MSLTSNLEIKKLTRESIQTALILLLQEKKWEDITITNIVERAGVSRMAYYRNYESKEDILKDISDDFIAKLTEITLPYIQAKKWYDYWKIIFDYIAQEVESSKLLLGYNYKVFFLDYLNDFCSNRLEDCSISEHYRIYGQIGLFFNIIVEWIENDMPISSEELAQICFELVNI